MAAPGADLARAEEWRQELRKLEQDVAAGDAEILQQRQKIQVLESGLTASSLAQSLTPNLLLPISLNRCALRRRTSRYG